MSSSRMRVRKPIRLRTELLWALALKLVLVLVIRFVFFSKPIGQEAKDEAIRHIFSSATAVAVIEPKKASPLNKESDHDQ